jgi:hypothetical protein
MGGLASGNRWCRSGRKATVEECYTLDIGLMLRQGRLKPGASGTVTWSDGITGRAAATIGFSVAIVDREEFILRLNYRIGDAEDVNLPIRLQATFPKLGGVRWWMTCPLIKDDQQCRRRVAKLHFQNRYFGCRHCLDLTYRSSQEAHQMERFRNQLLNLGLIDAARVREVEELLRKP